MKKTGLLLVAAACAASTFWADRALSYPEPELVARTWQFNFDYKQPRMISVQLVGETQPRHYWYIAYEITNNTGEDQLWVPSFTIYTNQGQILNAGKGVSPGVYEAIRKELKNPLLESPIDVVGKVLQGTDHARDSVAIWPVPDGDVYAFSLFVGGLSGETQVVEDPGTGEKVILRKTLELKYQTPGDEAHRLEKSFKLADQQWVMR